MEKIAVNNFICLLSVLKYNLLNQQVKEDKMGRLGEMVAGFLLKQILEPFLRIVFRITYVSLGLVEFKVK